MLKDAVLLLYIILYTRGGRKTRKPPYIGPLINNILYQFVPQLAGGRREIRKTVLTPYRYLMMFCSNLLSTGNRNRKKNGNGKSRNDADRRRKWTPKTGLHLCE